MFHTKTTHPRSSTLDPRPCGVLFGQPRRVVLPRPLLEGCIYHLFFFSLSGFLLLASWQDTHLHTRNSVARRLLVVVVFVGALCVVACHGLFTAYNMSLPLSPLDAHTKSHTPLCNPLVFWLFVCLGLPSFPPSLSKRPLELQKNPHPLPSSSSSQQQQQAATYTHTQHSRSYPLHGRAL